ncbi:MAG TPA: hypothetical protein VGP26_05880 [Actinophytocola sp.]|nr:hypothetical protein [Actinophytocola sp.]
MADLLLVRAEDLLVLGVSWSGMTRTGDARPGVPVLTATGEVCRLLITFPPQHVAEETSLAGTAAPADRPTGRPGERVPVWRAALSGPSRVAFDVPAGTRIELTIDGVLTAMANCAVLGPNETVIELPWRMAIAPAGPVRCAHRSVPAVADGVSGLWRTHLSDLDIVAVDDQLAHSADPGFALPLGQGDRVQVFTEASRRPARAARLELSTLGGTLDATGTWDNYLWEQSTVLGRDMRVRLLGKGALFPLGHRAEYLEYSERVIDPTEGNAAVLRSIRVLTVTEPVRRPPADPATRRAFPFDDVEITTRSFAELATPNWQDFPLPGGEVARPYFWPTQADGRQRVLFPVECATPDGPVRFELPLIFVRDLQPTFGSLTDPGLAAALAREYGGETVPLHGRTLDLVRAKDVRDGDRHEVQQIGIGGRLADGFRPTLTMLHIGLPAVRSLVGDDTGSQPARYSDAYLNDGESADVLLELTGPAIDLNFTGRADRSGGLVAPRYTADAISRTLGPVSRQALPDPATGLINPGSLFPAEATLLGFPLRDLLTQLKTPPEITSVLVDGTAPETSMRWTGVRLRSAGPFEAGAATRLDLTVTASAAGAETTCTVSDFAMVLPPGTGQLLRLTFGSMTFTQRTGEPARLDIAGLGATFLGSLRLLEELQKAVDLGGVGPLLDVTPTGITARYSLPVPPVAAGAFVLRNIVLSAGVVVPFDGAPVSVSLAFASRANPFSLSVLMFGGGGYIDVLIDHTGLRRLEAALEFGALIAVDFLVASAEVHVLGGVRYALEIDGSVSLTGYLRMGGCIEILGLVSISIELCVALSYRSDRNALVGRATVVIEIDLTLWSDSVELDSGEWVLAGGSGGGQRALFIAAGADGGDDDGLQRWREYRAAFARPHGGSS